MTTEETSIAPEPLRPSKRRKARSPDDIQVDELQDQPAIDKENKTTDDPISESLPPVAPQSKPIPADTTQADALLRKQRRTRRIEQQKSNLREATIAALQEALSRTEVGHYSSALAVVDVAAALLWTATELGDGT
jgi:hypothetical protein